MHKKQNHQCEKKSTRVNSDFENENGKKGISRVHFSSFEPLHPKLNTTEFYNMMEIYFDKANLCKSEARGLKYVCERVFNEINFFHSKMNSNKRTKASFSLIRFTSSPHHSHTPSNFSIVAVVADVEWCCCFFLIAVCSCHLFDFDRVQRFFSKQSPPRNA